VLGSVTDAEVISISLQNVLLKKLFLQLRLLLRPGQTVSGVRAGSAVGGGSSGSTVFSETTKAAATSPAMKIKTFMLLN
jgi:hypothetical protein